jgi:hypothetical protein
MQQSDYADQMSSYYSRFLVEALVQASRVKNSSMPPATPHIHTMTLRDFIQASAAEEARIAGMSNADKKGGRVMVRSRAYGFN